MVDEVDEGEPDAALGLEVHWEVEVVVLAVEVLVDELEHVVLHDSDWNILNHQGSLSDDLLVVVPVGKEHPVEIDLVVLGALEHLLLDLLVLGGLLAGLVGLLAGDGLVALGLGHFSKFFYLEKDR